LVANGTSGVELPFSLLRLSLLVRTEARLGPERETAGENGRSTSLSDYYYYYSPTTSRKTRVSLF